MRDTLLNLFKRFRRDEKGVTLVEYGVAVAVAVGVGLFAATNLVPAITDAMTAASNEMPAP